MRENLIRILRKICIMLEKKTLIEESPISSLAPKILTGKDKEKIQPYLDKIKETIDAKGINNIALAGGYGSGKSTIIKTFQHYNPQYEYLNISLASFNNKDSDNSSIASEEKKKQKEELERLLEVSILQQIFYHVKPTQIPESRFKRIINIPNWKRWGISALFILWLLSVILLLKYDYLDKINPITWKLKNSFDFIAFIIISIVFLGIGVFSKMIVSLLRNSRITKVSIKGELELGDNVNKSVFNEHLEEILYFFERTKYNVIIIEDLDRFDSTDIFTKLREINILLNNSKSIQREINFIYAVGDDLFKDKKERVKFFEYIIPVIPFINSSNADEQLKLLIKKSGLKEEVFTKEFISDITTFIDDIDMRLLINIFHEFVIYKTILKSEFIKKYDELLAIITYKNIDPKDFTLLNRNEGNLYEFIHNKRKYVQELIFDIDKQIQTKTIEIENINSESINDIEELKTIYFYKILSKLPSEALIHKAIFKNDFDEIIKSGKIKYDNHRENYYNSYETSSNFNFSEIENEVNSQLTYSERVKLIKSKQTNKTETLKREIEKLKQQKNEIEKWDLKQIFKEVNINKYLGKFSNNGLLRNFILNGYINENYNDYISLFHEVSITKEDFDFERSVKSGNSKNFDYELSNKVENLIERIDIKYFEREEILNFDLLDYLGKNYSKYSDKYDAVIRLLCNEREKSIRFIDGYIKNEGRPLGVFMQKLVENWKNFWEHIVEKTNYDRKKIDEYLRIMLTYTKTETILANQSKYFLDEMISTNSHFLSLVKNGNDTEYFQKISRLLSGLNIKFNGLAEPTKETQRLFNYVYENSLYKINKDNVLQMLYIYGKDFKEEDFQHSNYSTILKSECKPLIDYINSNISVYIETVYLQLENNKFEEEENLIALLNHKDIDNKLKIKITHKIETKISGLWLVDDLDMCKHLLINNKVTPTWNNVIYYWENMKEINDELVTFLNFEDVYSALSKMELKKENEIFENELIKSNQISDEAYRQLLKSTYFTWDELDFENLNIEKLVNLLDKKLNVTEENYHLLKEHFPSYHIRLIEKNFSEFINKIDNFETDEKDILQLLNSDKITSEEKLEYILYIPNEIIVNNQSISRAIDQIVLKKNTAIDLDYDIIYSLVNSCTSIEDKVKLVILFSIKLNNNELINITSSIGDNYKKMFEPQRKPTFGNTIFNKSLFDILKSKKLISSYKVDVKKDNSIRVTANYN